MSKNNLIHNLIINRKLKEYIFRTKLKKLESKAIDLRNQKVKKFETYIKKAFKERNLSCEIMFKGSSIHFIYNGKSCLQLNISRDKNNVQVYCDNITPFFYFKQGEINNQHVKNILDISKILEVYSKEKDIIKNNINTIHSNFANKVSPTIEKINKEHSKFVQYALNFNETISKKVSNILLKDLNFTFKTEKFDKLIKNIDLPGFIFDKGFEFDELEQIKLIKVNSNKYDVYIYPPKCIKPFIVKDVSKSHIKNFQFIIK